ncbi:hypothetical protein MD537_06895 [Flavihumibacter sediminis]|nr:hypothetical protein [Flavihumibacter sediminis]
MIENILKAYKKSFIFDYFYDNLFYNIERWPSEHNINDNFLLDYPYTKRTVIFEKQKKTEINNIRVDLPIWYGSPKSETRIIIIGQEPRDTDRLNGYLNIEHLNNYVFGTPFALERKVKHYHHAFQDLTNDPTIFTYFTDVVKSYHVISEDKILNDKYARNQFKKESTKEESLNFLTNEFETINPTKVITLGVKTHEALKSIFNDRYDIIRVRHPARGGHLECRRQIEEIMKSLKSNVAQGTVQA